MRREKKPLDDILKAIKSRYALNDEAQRIAELYRLGLLPLDEAIKSIFAL